MTVSEIRERMDRSGSHWFSPQNMRFYRTKVYPRTYTGVDGIYFVTSEMGPWGESPGPRVVRRYSVRLFQPKTTTIKTVGEFGGYSDEEDAVEAIRNYLRGVESL